MAILPLGAPSIDFLQCTCAQMTRQMAFSGPITCPGGTDSDANSAAAWFRTDATALVTDQTLIV